MIASDAAMLAASVVMFNHLGLCEAIEHVTGYRFRILSCAKCGTFWVVLGYLLLSEVPVVASVASSFLLSYLSIWFELLLGYLAERYEKLSNEIQAASPDPGEAGTATAMPEV